MSLRPNPLSQCRFPWGDAAVNPERANYEETGIGNPSGVGCSATDSSPYGCEEMMGTVWECVCSLWGRYDREQPGRTSDLVFDPLFTYPYRSDDGRENLDADMWWLRVQRGGSWKDEAWLGCTSRDRRYLNYRFNVVGFRMCVRASVRA